MERSGVDKDIHDAAMRLFMALAPLAKKAKNPVEARCHNLSAIVAVLDIFAQVEEASHRTTRIAYWMEMIEMFQQALEQIKQEEPIDFAGMGILQRH